MTLQVEGLDPATIPDLMAKTAQYFQRYPEDAELVFGIVSEHLVSKTKLGNADRYESIGQRFHEVLPAIVHDPRLEPVRTHLDAEQPPEEALLAAVGLGLAAGLFVAGAIVIYCLNSEDGC